MLFRLSLVASVLLLAGCESSPDDSVDYADGVSEAGSFADPAPMADAAPGTVQPNSTVRLDYTGTLPDGSTFDSGSNVTFQMMQMVPGFRDGMVGMAPGETKIFDVQPADGYGNNPPPGIPQGAVLTFEVTAHEIL